MERKLPVGVQSFEKLRTENFIYVDKTEYIYRLVHNNIPYFLSRPRRFGKSLLLSTLKAYWEGKKELFTGLAIEGLERENKDAWKPYPIFYFDFNGEDYEVTSVEEVLDQHLSEWEEIYGSQYSKSTPGYRFQKLLEMAAQKTGLRCVVLVDEYDKPLLDLIEHPEKEEYTKKVFKAFFSRLKKADEFIQFIFITGVSKFHKVSIFSDLNQLSDISLNEEYAALCGITERDIRDYFLPETGQLAENQDMTVPECLEMLKAQYDGYHFHYRGEGVYNPYSLLKCFFEKEPGAYWFETGTPSFILKKIMQNRFDIRKLTERTIYANEALLRDYTGDNPDLVPLLYQTGYLTIADYEKRLNRYTLGFPNEEVKYGFLESLMPSYVPAATAGNGMDIFTLESYIETADLDGVRRLLTALFANITYTSKADPFEHYFQSVIYIVFTLLGKFVACEMHTYTGRIDCLVKTLEYLYLFEFKRDVSAEEALAQINDKDYTLPFPAEPRKLFRIGVSFDSESRRLVGWEVKE